MRIRRGGHLPLPLPVLFGLALSFAFSAPAAAQRARLQPVDPLTEPPPKVQEPIVLRSSPLSPTEKLVPGLRETAKEADPGGVLRIIVTLWEPSVDIPMNDSKGESEQSRLQILSALEHQFVNEASGTGFVAERGFSHFPIVVGTIKAERLRQLSGLSQVRAVEEVLTLRAARVEGGQLVRSPQLRNQFSGAGAGIGVAVLDSGIDATHPELLSKVTVEGDYTETTGDGTVDDNGHGTAVGGIIAGSAGGTAPQAELWAIKVIKADGSADTADVSAALNDLYAVRNDFGGLNVINMSLEVPSPVFNDFCDHLLSPASALVMENLVKAGISIFAASGNGGLNGVAFPGCLSSTIAVGAVYDANVGSQGPFPGAEGCVDSSTQADRITCYSNSGFPLDILAPSNCVRTPVPGGGYDNCFGGTSAATPYAAGAAAQILSLLPGATPPQVLEALQSTGRPRTDVNGITRNRIDALAAFQFLQGGGDGGDSPPPPPGSWLSSSALPGFEAKVLINDSTPGSRETDCIPETLCVSGALAGRPEIFVKVIGPRPNGFLWSQLSRFTPSKVEVWLRQISTGQINYYELAAVGQAEDNVSGLQDREAFSP